MKEVHFKNGLTLTYDDEISVGTLITAYHAGFHVLTDIEYRENAPPIFHYTKVISAGGKASGKVKNSCDASYCRKVTREGAEKLRAAAVEQAESQFKEILTYLE